MEKRQAAIKLFGNQHAHELMGHRHPTEAQACVTGLAKPGREPVRSTDDERDRAAIISIPFQNLTEFEGGSKRPAFIESNRHGPCAESVLKALCFVHFAGIRIAIGRFAQLANINLTKAKRLGGRLAPPPISIEQFAFWTAFEPPDAKKRE